ncbi:MAG TPA: hypothetical protein VGR47_20775 [Terracidiphilus sp.]|nr:hypothetical protein [Terracidiphilus sp.]
MKSRLVLGVLLLAGTIESLYGFMQAGAAHDRAWMNTFEIGTWSCFVGLVLGIALPFIVTLPK